MIGSGSRPLAEEPEEHHLRVLGDETGPPRSPPRRGTGRRGSRRARPAAPSRRGSARSRPGPSLRPAARGNVRPCRWPRFRERRRARTGSVASGSPASPPAQDHPAQLVVRGGIGGLRSSGAAGRRRAGRSRRRPARGAPGRPRTRIAGIRCRSSAPSFRAQAASSPGSRTSASPPPVARRRASRTRERFGFMSLAR